uniref:Acyl-coenzyme A thioesterase 13 n=1 Tax=Oryza barthii TaxID=65489 RepID=A0A0D3FW32_9ORYZ
MDPEAVRRSLEPTALSKEVVGPASASLRYDAFALTGVRIDAAEHGRLLCSFVSPAGYLLSGVTATLADQLGSGVFLSSGIGTSGVSLELNLSYVDVASIGEEIEVEGKLLRAGKSVGVVSVDFRKKMTGKLIAQARHTKYLAHCN